MDSTTDSNPSAVPDGELIRCFEICLYDTQNDKEKVQTCHVLRVHKDPDIQVAMNLLNDEQINHLLEISEGKWERSKTSIGQAHADQGTYQSLESTSRTSMSCCLSANETPIVTTIEKVVCAFAKIPIQYLEALVVIKYSEGEYFNQHHDGAFRPYTVLLYLNDVEEGGETHFTALGIKLLPMRGCGVIWPNLTPEGEMDMQMIHAGCSPKKGVKYAVNCFFNKEMVRDIPQVERPLKTPIANEESNSSTQSVFGSLCTSLPNSLRRAFGGPLVHPLYLLNGFSNPQLSMQRYIPYRYSHI